MKYIDGSQGEGGGQIFRTSLTLSMCTGEPVTITNIRAGRKKPGLLRQHLTCLKAAQEVSNASVEGAELGSGRVVFRPGRVKAGRYHFSIGSAGSTTLVFQTLYLPLLMADGDSELLLEGGTHNGLSPSVDFLQYAFFPQLKKMGVTLDAELLAYGFYPAGGGCWRAGIFAGAAIGAYQNSETRGALRETAAVVTSAKIPQHVAERELRRVADKLRLTSESLSRNMVSSVGPGNMVSLRASFDNITEVVEVIGERGVVAESVADKAIGLLNRYLASAATIGEHLADQLLLPMALGGGGSFTTLKPSQHLETNAAVIQALTSVRIDIVQLEENLWRVNVDTN